MSRTKSRPEHNAPTVTLARVNVDSVDPGRQARVFEAALGWEVIYSDDSYGMIEGNGIKIGFGKIERFNSVSWPDEAGAKRFHFDLQVDDLDEATERLCALGSSQPAFQPGAGRWRVLLDPDGQPFCLSPRPVGIQ